VSPDRARELLEAERSRAASRLDALRGDHRDFVDASRDSNADDEHDPEGATIAFERAQVGTLVQQSEQHLAEVAAALARLEDGAYGECLRCGARLPDERLEARPSARTCVTCS
jgi:RNA polymerase-binding transcription factor DksA